MDNFSNSSNETPELCENKVSYVGEKRNSRNSTKPADIPLKSMNIPEFHPALRGFRLLQNLKICRSFIE
jgi:hypothetical protein